MPFLSARLSEAILFNATARHAVFEEAHVRQIILTGSDFSGAKFTNAVLQDTITEGAILPIRMPIPTRLKRPE